MLELLVATHNLGKLQEYRDLLPDYEFVGLGDIGLGSLDVDETGTTFLENAALKATTYARASGRITLSDDSGLCVDALDGAPGLYSARYGGAGLDDGGRRAHLLANMQHVPEGQRTAQFVCVIALHDPRDGKTYAVEGISPGRILLAESNGTGGFGYDRLFVPDGYDLSFADMPAAQKHALSHRGRAVVKLQGVLREVLNR
jgi:XTP/dITP diphosphohydrolase